MDMYKKYKSALGYEVGEDGIDSYGVDHSGFSTRDELAYQFARDKREGKLLDYYQSQGINDNYPQYGTEFWGGSAENNYGFGSSNISQNIRNVSKHLNNIGFNAGANSGQGFTNSDYMVNTKSLIGKPSSYFQNNNSVGSVNDQPRFGKNNYAISTNTAIGQPNSAESNNSIFQTITALNPINAGYQIGQKIGELAADTKMAYDYWQKMNQTGNQLVKTFGSGQGADIDNYYHPLLQCELAKISPQSRDNGIALGYAKEYLMDYPKKRFLKRQSHDEIMKDSRKDLKNNLYGSNLGYNNPNRSCEDLLDGRRTPNMRKLGIR